MKKLIAFLAGFLFLTSVYGQKIIFLHHSVGGDLFWQGGVEQWFANYNSAHSTNYQIYERAYPNTPYSWNNNPYDYWNLWINNQCNNTNPNIECLDKITQNYDVIVFKHCFNSAAVEAANGNPLVSSAVQTLDNYKLQYRALRTKLDTYPSKKFIVWTLAPYHRLGTTTEAAARAKQFVDWVKTSWLTEDGKSHPNIYIFDFWSNAAESNPTPVNGKLNCLKYNYEINHTVGDSHPNPLADQTIGPIFSQFVVNTILNQPTDIDASRSMNNLKIYPNPASNEVNIDLAGNDSKNSSVEIFNLQGILVSRELYNNDPILKINTQDLDNGIYIVSTKTGLNTQRNKLYIIK